MHQIEILDELGYGVMRSTDVSYIMDYFFVFKIKMIDLIDQNIFYMKIKNLAGAKFYILYFFIMFLLFFKIVKKSLFLNDSQ
jgi:hypothetical protein